MSSKRKREKEDSAKPRRTKKLRSAVSTKAGKETGRPSSVDQTELLVPDGTSSHAMEMMEDDHEESLDHPSDQVASQWSVRESVGGRLLDLDPVFSKDGQHYILAYTSGVKVYSCETSLLVQSLSCAAGAPIVALAISPSDSSSLIVGTANGQIERWAWMTGNRTAGFDIASPISALAIARISTDEPAADVVFVSYGSGDEWCLAAYAFENEYPSEKDETPVTILSSQTRISILETCENGQLLIASDGNRVMIGSKQPSATSSLESLDYFWREFTCTGTISSAKPRISKPGAAKHPPVLDLAIGTREGVIYVYRDVINQMVSAKQSREILTVTRFHWHRNAVASLDWSRDGNYLMSGGEETVLVLWQLNSNQKSFLPHLSAPILRAVVSPSGDSYGITLADNSSMVLKALTLEPETSISEPQLFLRDSMASSRATTKAQPIKADPVQLWRVPITVAKSSPRLLFSTSPSETRDSGMENSVSPFLHTYDFKSGAQISKQALARTFTTDRRVGPHGEKLQEPKIVLLQVSASEKWLVTVDEWLPYAEERYGSRPLATYSRQTRQNAMESNLRFWSWRESKKSWEMVWRAELSRYVQHHDSTGGKSILDLAADPQETKFYTLSGDHTVLEWYPTQRLRSGMQVKDEENQNVSDWSCRQVGVLPMLTNNTGASPSSGKIAVSRDGSLLLVALSAEARGVVGIFDTRSRDLLSVHLDKSAGPIRGLGIAGSCAVVLSDIFTAWDLVDTGRMHKAELGNPGAKRNDERRYFHLACNDEDETFAVVSPTIDQKSLVTILKGRTLTPEATVSLPTLITALLPAPSQRGFIAVNADSEISLITSSGHAYTAQTLDKPQSSGPEYIGLDRVFGDIALHAPQVGTKPSGQHSVSSNKGDLIVPDKHLSEPLYNSGETDPLRRIFESSQPLSSPAVIDTFRQVAAVLSKSTRVSN